MKVLVVLHLVRSRSERNSQTLVVSYSYIHVFRVLVKAKPITAYHVFFMSSKPLAIVHTHEQYSHHLVKQ
jgi:hypothetical protein